jgi:hypothetical protein
MRRMLIRTIRFCRYTEAGQDVGRVGWPVIVTFCGPVQRAGL